MNAARNDRTTFPYLTRPMVWLRAGALLALCATSAAHAYDARCVTTVAQLKAAGDAADEPAWELPLVRKYRRQLDSKLADIRNMGGVNAGTITAGLFLEEFTAGIPFGHLDICGPMMTESDDAWRSVGATAFGTRLLIELALGFRSPAA